MDRHSGVAGQLQGCDGCCWVLEQGILAACLPACLSFALLIFVFGDDGRDMRGCDGRHFFFLVRLTCFPPFEFPLTAAGIRRSIKLSGHWGLGDHTAFFFFLFLPWANLHCGVSFLRIPALAVHGRMAFLFFSFLFEAGWASIINDSF